MIRLGILGTGGMASQRATSFAAMDGVRVTHLWSRNPKKELCWPLPAGVCVTNDYAAMLQQVDAVIVCLPNTNHAEMALLALQAGKHVLVEYPLCATLAEFNDLQQAAQSAQVVLMTGNTIVHETMFSYIQNNRSRLGSLLSAASRVSAYDDALCGQWFMQPTTTGPEFSSFHYHHVEYYRHLLGQVDTVWACSQHAPDTQHPSHLRHRGGTLTMQHLSGSTSTIHWYLFADQPSSGSSIPRCLWLNGTQDTLTLIEHADHCQAIWGQGGEDREETFTNDWGVTGSCRSFIKAIEGTIDHQAQLESDKQTLQVCWAASESAAKRHLVGISRNAE